MCCYYHRSPEVNTLKAGKPVVISSEFPSWQDDKGQSKGGVLLFKFGKQKKAKTAPKKLKVDSLWSIVYSLRQSIKLLLTA